eukprot:2449813-Rhodomonas_salina.2
MRFAICFCQLVKLYRPSPTQSAFQNENGSATALEADTFGALCLRLPAWECRRSDFGRSLVARIDEQCSALGAGWNTRPSGPVDSSGAWSRACSA